MMVEINQISMPCIFLAGALYQFVGVAIFMKICDGYGKLRLIVINELRIDECRIASNVLVFTLWPATLIYALSLWLVRSKFKKQR